ncbi:hypothetical protein [Streptomyces lavendulocolor]|uniref:hypothetical protein n=1 Tax=Streptomyces lavendulocolor TaxID=67316 RepID=UPI003C2D3B7A
MRALGADLSTSPFCAPACAALVSPAHAAAEPRPTRTGRGANLPDIERVQRLALNTDA